MSQLTANGEGNMRIYTTTLFVILLGWPIPVWAQAGSGTVKPSARDFERPLKDLEEIEGEVVWLQGVLLGGDPTPYQDPQVPLAAYEQGLLDEDGQLWTVLDTPKGRELRYNPELRGQRVAVKAWLYPESKILNVQTWSDSQKHPVRLQEDFPEPERIPFDPSKAEDIETIKPVAPKRIQSDLLEKSLWEIQEGTDLSGQESLSRILPEISPETEQFQDILREEGLIPSATVEEPLKENSSSSEGEGRQSVQPPEPSETSISPRVPADSRSSLLPLQGNIERKILNEEGEPLARPEEFDEALERSLFD